MTVDPRWQNGRPEANNSGRRATAPRSAVNRIALSRAITFSGGNAAYIALLALLYQETHSASLVGLGALASFGVPALVSPVAGLIGDRFDRRRVMIASELLGAACFLLMAAFPSAALLLVLRVVASLSAAPFVPATSAALPGLVDGDEQLADANAKLASASIFGALFGAFFAAMVMLISSPEAVFLLNTLTFIASATLIASIQSEFQSTHTFSEQSRIAALAAGFQYLDHHRTLRLVTLAYGFMFLGVGLTGPAEIVLSTNFGAGATGLAAFTCVFGLGGIAGTRLSSRGLKRIGIGATATLTAASSALALGFLTIGFAPDFSLAVAGMAVAGTAYGIWGVAHENLVQRTTPDAIRGRVFAASEAVEHAGMAFGLLGAGALISTFGAAGAFRIGAVGSIAAFLLLATTRASLPSLSQLVPATTVSSSPPSQSAALARIQSEGVSGTARTTDKMR